MRRGPARRSGLSVLALASVLVLVAALPASAAKPRVVLLVPFDASGLEREERWVGEGVLQVLTLAFAQHPGVAPVERSRLRAYGRPEVWGEGVVAQAARALKAEAALFGRVERRGTELVLQARLLETKPAATDVLGLEPVPVPEGELLARLAGLPVVVLRALRVPVSEADAVRVERAARPTTSLQAFELYARGQAATARGDREGHEAAVDLLARAIEVAPNFVAAHYALGTVHQALGNRWKAAAQYRASTQLDPTYPEPLKALGDLFISAPRRLFDQAIEAYGKALELRPFYAEAHVGLGDARAAKGDVDGAVKAYQQALLHNPLNPRVHVSLGRIYYVEKGLYYEAVTAYKRAIELDPLFVDARMGLGEVYEDKGLYQEAIGEYRTVVEQDARNTGALYNLALVYEKVDPREAVALWERYIQLAGGLPSEKDWVDVARLHLRKLKNQLEKEGR
jgi:tetratricopeptide (TPR) repeat protein